MKSLLSYNARCQMHLFKLLQPMLLIISGAVVFAANTMAEERLIDDFSKAPEQQWRFIADSAMGGVSVGSVMFTSENGVYYAQLAGNVSTDNNGGFIQIRKKLDSPPSTSVTGIKMTVRGNNQKYFLHLRTSGTILPWQYYQAGFNVTGRWTEVRIPLTGFQSSGGMLAKAPTPQSLRSVALVAFGRDHNADVQISEISFY